jgi:hypothetical protein
VVNPSLPLDVLSDKNEELDLASVENAFADIDDDACCCNRADCPRWLTWCNAMHARDEDLRLAAEIGQALLENHELYVEQARQMIQELRDKCQQGDRRIAALMRECERWKRAAESAGHERDTIVEERNALEKVSHLRCDVGKYV